MTYTSKALQDVADERGRQIEVEGWTPEHDDHHIHGELAAAGACYALEHQGWQGFTHAWPWEDRWWKPQNRRYNLVRAGALIVAEIERLDRAEEARAGSEK